MPFSRSGPLRGLDAYCKDDELSEIGSQLAEGSINAGTVKPWRNSAFVLLVLARAPASLRADLDRHLLTEVIGPTQFFDRLHDAVAAFGKLKGP